MTIDTVKFQDVLDRLFVAQNATTSLNTAVDLADPENTFEVDFEVIQYKLQSIENWTNEKILEAEQEQVMASFLSELKVVFDKYSASSAITPFETGWGESYGEPGTGFLLTASLDGVISTKEIKKSVIGSGELV